MIDFWDVKTFDAELLSALKANQGLIERFQARKDFIFNNYERTGAPDTLYAPPSNEHNEEYNQFVDELDVLVRTRGARLWHYTRLTDDEVSRMRRSGIQLLSQATLHRRLDDRIEAGDLTHEEKARILSTSVLHGQQEGREHSFWCTSHPIPDTDVRVKLLLQNWGGESVYWGLESDQLKRKVTLIGAPRIIELCAPLDQRLKPYRRPGEAVIAGYACSIGVPMYSNAFDARYIASLPSESVLSIHTQGDETFAQVGRTYPLGYLDIDLEHTKILFPDDF